MGFFQSTLDNLDGFDITNLTVDCDSTGSIAIFKKADANHSRNGKELRFKSFELLVKAVDQVIGIDHKDKIVGKLKESSETIKNSIKTLGGVDSIILAIKTAGKELTDTNCNEELYNLITIYIPNLRFNYRDYLMYIENDRDIINEAKSQSVLREPPYMNIRVQGYGWIEDCDNSSLCLLKNLCDTDKEDYDTMIEVSSGWEVPVSIYNMSNDDRCSDSYIEKQYTKMFKAVNNLLDKISIM